MEDGIKRDKILYMSPLKSLTTEKYEDWKIRFPNKNICILTSDYVLSKKKSEELSKAHIILCTSEMVDSRTRKFHSEKNYWLSQVGLLIIDESHILTTERGHAVESGIMRFTKLNPKARILFLSATMPNVDELGSWLTDLNKKETEVVYFTWRPVELQMNFLEYPLTFNKWGREDYWASQEKKREIVIKTVLSKPNEKFLVFVHDKGTGRDLIRRFTDKGITSHFHSADLDQKERLEIEGKFQDKNNGIKVLVSTSTLAWGRNLPARNVVICGVHRGINKVDELDVIQMAGRAGRYGIDDAGFVYLVIPQMTTGHWKNIFENPRPVLSVLNNKETLAFHALAEIDTKNVRSSNDLLNWYSRSLAFKQGDIFTEQNAQALSEELFKMEMIDKNFRVTGLGKVSAMMYFSPYDIDAWHINFNTIFEDNVEVDDILLSWALGDVPSNDMGYTPKPLEQEIRDFTNALKERNIFHPSNAIVSSLAIYSKISDNDDFPAYLKPFSRAVGYDINRQVQALSMIDKMYSIWEKEDLWEVLPSRVIYGIPEDLIELVKIPGVGATRAKKLWQKDLRSAKMVAESSDKILFRIFNPSVGNKIREAAKKLTQK